MLAVGGAAVEVVGRAGAVGGQSAGLGWTGPGRECLFYGAGPQRGLAHVHQGDVAALDRDADDRPVDRALGELLERPMLRS